MKSANDAAKTTQTATGETHIDAAHALALRIASFIADLPSVGRFATLQGRADWILANGNDAIPRGRGRSAQGVGIIDFALRHIARSSSARPMFSLCSYCGDLIAVKEYGSANPCVSHGGHPACIEKEFPEYAAAMAAMRAAEQKEQSK